MEIKSYANAGAFLEDHLSLLETEEAANNLILGIALGIHQGTSLFKEAHFMGVMKGGQPVLCALQTPPRNLLVYGASEYGAKGAALLYPYVIKEGIDVPGLIGSRAFVTPFAESWSTLAGVHWEIKQGMGVFQLDEAISPGYSPGRLRPATQEDEGLAFQWIREFHVEALGEADDEFYRKLVNRHLKRGELFLWENAMPVSMAAATRPTRNGITINAVYTPPEHRGSGYASNCVAQVSQQMLDSGYRFCALFTNLSNPTSNKIYQAIGYKKVAEFLEVRWV
ncbi:MAG: GNAT family N-acetyltransferase [Lewinellaceae bacterium]|nr:GNAT family N-acetyltransferase [Phaeodactylibacter sp.]MCB0611688.1 GNAT family N-acetyltransferase [Phaeodactylibacter sp.]MCB9351274.1 GNAT family N-acetyltransferase [Lewinellaceae bacterium]